MSMKSRILFTKEQYRGGGQVVFKRKHEQFC